jgi:hypothetical protein
MGDLEDLKIRFLSYVLRGGDMPSLEGLDRASLEELEDMVWWVPLAKAEGLRQGWPDDKIEALEDVKKMVDRTIKLLRKIESAKVATRQREREAEKVAGPR